LLPPGGAFEGKRGNFGGGGRAEEGGIKSVRPFCPWWEVVLRRQGKNPRKNALFRKRKGTAAFVGGEGVMAKKLGEFIRRTKRG